MFKGKIGNKKAFGFLFFLKKNQKGQGSQIYYYNESNLTTSTGNKRLEIFTYFSHYLHGVLNFFSMSSDQRLFFLQQGR